MPTFGFLRAAAATELLVAAPAFNADRTRQPIKEPAGR